MIWVLRMLIRCTSRMEEGVGVDGYDILGMEKGREGVFFMIRIGR